MADAVGIFQGGGSGSAAEVLGFGERVFAAAGRHGDRTVRVANQYPGDSGAEKRDQRSSGVAALHLQTDPRRGSSLTVFVRCLIFSFFVGASLARAETIVSQSQQFVVHSSGRKIAINNIPAGTVEALPEFLVVTAERVRRALVAEIPAIAEARSPIHIGIIDNAGVDNPVTIGSSRFADGWKYEMAVPRVVEESRLVKGLISALLLQYANHGSERSAELPAWVT